MSKEVTITFSGITSPILKAITNFKLQKRNMKGLTEEQKQKVLDELDDLFIVMISDTKLNKGKPVWDFINLREEYIYENNKNADESTICDFRYNLYRRMLDNKVPLETALYCLYGYDISYDYIEEFNINYINDILDDIIKMGYIHKNVKKLKDMEKRIFLWSLCTNIEKKKIKLNHSLIYTLTSYFIFLSVRGYGDEKTFEYDDFFYKGKINVVETHIFGSLINNIYERSYNNDISLRGMSRYFMSKNSNSLSAKTLLNFVKIITCAKNGIDIYSDDIILLLFTIMNDRYDYGIHDIPYIFEEKEYKDEFIHEIIKLISKGDIDKLCKNISFNEDANLKYFEELKKLFVDNDTIKEKLMELKLSNKGE